MTLVSCGMPKQADTAKRSNNQIDEAFQQYVEEFEATYSAETGSTLNVEAYDIPINFGDPNSSGGSGSTNYVGSCKTYSNGKKEIIISVDSWERYPRSMKRQLIYHELGHCLLGKEHVDTRNSTGTPISVMSRVLINQETYESYMKEYDHELFTGDTSDILHAIGS